MPPYDILVVDDSVFMRKIITDLISEDPAFRVVGAAKNGREGVEMVKKLKPHAVTLDIEMPEMNGLEALKAIMKDHPVPVIMLSSLTQEGAAETIRALEWGAFDFVGKPSGSISLDLHKVKALLLEKLHTAVKAKVRPVTGISWSSRTASAAQAAPPASRTPAAAAPPVPPMRTETPAAKPPERIRSAGAGVQTFDHLVAIGTSTGGPRALHQVLSDMPDHYPAPVLIVQHMPPNFTKSLAQRLDSISKLTVVEAENGMVLERGTAYVAPGGYHMTVARNGTQSYKIHLSKDEPRGGHRPSVDTMFESLLPLKELKRHIVIMTGMGADGAKGMQALKQAGAITTIAESEETCVVYGMPRAAVELGCVMHVVPQQQIAGMLIQSVGR
ncbi:protein-glutamate methylesterase/protein-glutamine glutaminase [Paenibacillus mucilaginosus]|uniref:Protein-glutamate methylesterase/protein-glutamine glutaminase n=3 Tax=Paenibacillus mucilaginosus TaxID=61624 RepID=H6NQ35_9BACL|nr:chemotaxis response regulator protein-glutamate methylesterase [Paenibacillus mucilaginosus]AEI44321.1 chemotaxis-specific methylesterase [Paenibacillus mucilaginosus KNP414]AFC31859.1 chemotaxis-specific methylesterase [Paenibacillus mucilaginosus 3016]AFH64216.1 chemotaxis protein CheY [Paenibacillus mucilaginosus K02]MCG7217625.1 chemotaxis response regulator protein-glutamate methylesterase [Paenibacillus mucilaginosus]WDM25717.1 chemotaxis response regulator protein-glutamate methylest